MRPLAIAIATFAISALLAGRASAHIQLISPAPRTEQQKAGPCGVAGSTRGTSEATFAPGSTITVSWREAIDHPSHYRLSLDTGGQDQFADPASTNDFYSSANVLADQIQDRSGGGLYSYYLTLPDRECQACTLQLIQVMYDKPPYGDGNDIYYQCADIALSTPADSGGSSGCSISPSSGHRGARGLGSVLLAGLAAVARPRRPARFAARFRARPRRPLKQGEQS